VLSVRVHYRNSVPGAGAIQSEPQHQVPRDAVHLPEHCLDRVLDRGYDRVDRVARHPDIRGDHFHPAARSEMFKTYNGEKIALPIIGPMAEKQAAA
jgi:hypothetical protein